MKVLVTGADGFVGRHTVRALKERGHSVIGADKVSGNDLTSLDVAMMVHAAAEPDVVIHLAGHASTPGSLADPMASFNANVLTAANVLEAARVDKTPVIITSSVKARDGKTPYGAAKRMVETWAYEFADSFGMEIIINRPGTIYGPGQEGSPESGWIAWFCRAKREALPVTIYGDGSQKRDLLHVRDYVRLLILEAENIDAYSGRMFDVGGGPDNTVTVLQIVRHLGLTHRYDRPRYGDAVEYIGINDVPNWSPRVKWWESETLRG